MSQMSDLLDEFKSLKSELFGGDVFLVVDYSDPKVIRYNQLLGFFYPQYRTSDWITPVK